MCCGCSAAASATPRSRGSSTSARRPSRPTSPACCSSSTCATGCRRSSSPTRQASSNLATSAAPDPSFLLNSARAPVVRRCTRCGASQPPESPHNPCNAERREYGERGGGRLSSRRGRVGPTRGGRRGPARLRSVAVMLELRSLTRRFGPVLALDDVGFAVRPGVLTGFIGANGAGKTTTMRIVVGVLAPDSGEVLWPGVPVAAQERRRFGYMPEERGLYPKMSVLDQLVFFARLHGYTAQSAERRAPRARAEAGRWPRADDRLEK